MTSIQGMSKYKLEPFEDHRGVFCRLFDESILNSWGKIFNVRNINLSQNPRSHTLRGFHYSEQPEVEDKIFFCTSGSIVNFTIDVRRDSSTYLKVEKNILDSREYALILVPGNCANAWMTLEDKTNILYFVGASYDDKFERGLRYDDGYFNISWPYSPAVISQKDLSWPDFNG